MENEELDKRILEAAKTWKTPFKPGSENAAKDKLMQMAAKHSEKNTEGTIWMRVAASVAILAIVPVVLLFIGNTQVENNGSQIITHTFPCESSAVLNPGSKIQYNHYFWIWRRRVQFSGQAYFHVEKKGNKFVVDGACGDVDVLGTEFTVWASNSALFAHCSNGEVQVKSDTEKEILKPDEFTVISGSRLDPVQSWKRTGFIKPNANKKELIFEDIPIGVAIFELEVSLGLKIQHSLDPGLRYSGRLDPANPDHCIGVFCKTFNANFVKEEDFVSIHP